MGDLGEDFALELAMLEAAFPPKADIEGDPIDLRGVAAVIGLTARDTLCFGRRANLGDGPFLALLFAAAWKVLDIVIERGLQLRDAAQSRPQIATKVKYAVENRGLDFLPLVGDPDLAEALSRMYGRTHQLRHAVVHRRIPLLADGSLLLSDPDLILTKAEVVAFCELALLVGRCASFPADRRTRSHAAWFVNQLARVHGGLDLSEAHEPRQMDSVLVVAARETCGWVVNTERAFLRAQTINNGYPFAWLEVHAPGGEFACIVRPLHDAPRGMSIRFDPERNPPW